jgi:hypothetical protein
MKPPFKHPLAGKQRRFVKVGPEVWTAEAAAADHAKIVPDFRTCLSVKQPWAWLLTHGYKDVENRTWTVGYRGELWIHAGKAVDATAYESLVKAFPNIPLPPLADLPRMGLVGTVQLVKIVADSTSVWAMKGCNHWLVEHGTETTFEPMPGRQGLFHAGNQRLHLPTPPHPTACDCGHH